MSVDTTKRTRQHTDAEAAEPAWNPPTYPEGTHVIYSKDPTRSDRSLGKIIKNGGRGMADLLVDIYYPGGGFRQEVHEDCYLVGDPVITERPMEFWSGENGVYSLAPIEEQRLALERRMLKLEADLNAILHPNK